MKLLYDKYLINKKIVEMGKSISIKYKGENPIFIGILNGSFIFLADLLRAINIKCEVDFIKIQSYEGLKSTGKINLVKDISINIGGRHIILVEDIIDTGNSIRFLLDKLKNSSCKSISIATFLIKSKINNYDFTVDHIGYEIGQDFVVGYGLDFNQSYRNLDGIYILD